MHLILYTTLLVGLAIAQVTRFASSVISERDADGHLDPAVAAMHSPTLCMGLAVVVFAAHPYLPAFAATLFTGVAVLIVPGSVVVSCATRLAAVLTETGEGM